VKNKRVIIIIIIINGKVQNEMRCLQFAVWSASNKGLFLQKKFSSLLPALFSRMFIPYTQSL